MRQTQCAVKIASILTLAAICSACGSLPAHNNTLIFAVKRDFGASLSTPSAADPELSLSLGYKERQAAWVPLWVNDETGGLGFNSKKAKDCQVHVKVTHVGVPAAGTPALEDIGCKKGPKLIGDGTPNANLARGNDINDAYSTFASFGGDVNVGKDEGGSGRLALASFFATGVAAQNLSKNASGLAMVSNKPAEVDKSEAKSPSNAANRLAQDELLALFESISPQATPDEPKETLKACLTKLGSEFDPKEPAQFEWLSAMPPKDAVERWGKATSLSDDAYRKLVGVAFNMRKNATKEVGAAVQTSSAAKTAAESDTAKAEGNAKRTKAIEVFCAPKTAAVAGGKS